MATEEGTQMSSTTPWVQPGYVPTGPYQPPTTYPPASTTYVGPTWMPGPSREDKLRDLAWRITKNHKDSKDWAPEKAVEMWSRAYDKLLELSLD